MTLIEAAKDVRTRAYAPYSNYRVGAAIQDADGRVFTGANVENISYGATICAERSAIAKMISEGGSRIRSVVVVTKDGGTPCGICLQTILEFSAEPEKVEVIAVNEASETRSYRLSQLFPLGFQSSEVGRTE